MQATLTDGTRFGSYEIVQPLGSGGMGEVYLARDLRLDRLVAIKIIAPSVAGDPARLARFIREAKTASSLNHPNIAHVYEIGEWNGVPFIAMEYVRGDTLTSRIGSRGMPIGDVIIYATQIADALDEAHSHGIIHRDLKPANAIISGRGKLKILDFGLAKIVGPSEERDSALSTMPGDTMAGLVLGTLHYMSPEQLRGLEVDRRSDVFSFGVVLYEMITGRLPFASTSKTDMVYRITQVQPESLTRFNYDVPADLERIVRKCLEKEPDRRYQSVRELLIDLSNLRRDTSGIMLPAQDIAHRAPRQRQWLAAGALALAGLGAAGTAAAWLRKDVIDSIVVLPETPAAASPQEVDLTDGLAASLANSLSQLPNLKVAPRQRATRGSADSDPLDIARKLGMHGVLTVRVILKENRAQLSLTLEDANHPQLVWGDQLTRTPDEIGLAQQNISAEIAERLRLRLGAEDRRALEVFQLYQSGRYHAAKRTADDLRQASVFYNRALEKNPNYALAHAGLADVYNLLPTFGAMEQQEGFKRAKTAAERALALDDTLAEAHTQLGWVFFRWDWDWAAAERELTRAIALNPEYAQARQWTGNFLAAMGRFEDAIVRVREAQRLDSLSPAIRADVAWIHYIARQYTAAIEASQRAVNADPKSWLPYRYLGLAYMQLRDFDQAIKAFETANLLGGPSTQNRAELAYAYALAGRRADATRILGDHIAAKQDLRLSVFPGARRRRTRRAPSRTRLAGHGRERTRQPARLGGCRSTAGPAAQRAALHRAPEDPQTPVTFCPQAPRAGWPEHSRRFGTMSPKTR
jgi:serine/threonine protein kinase/tetratricopeptide (TPR) repeat protein